MVEDRPHHHIITNTPCPRWVLNLLYILKVLHIMKPRYINGFINYLLFVEKVKILNTPYPVWIIYPFQLLWDKITDRYDMPRLSQKHIRIVLVVMAILALPVIWIFEGFGNPLEILVDIPLFSFMEYSGDPQLFYMIFLTFFTMVTTAALKFAICRDKDFELFSLNSILLWIASLSVGVMVDAFVRNVFLDWFVAFFNKIYTRYTMSAGDTNEKTGFIALMLLLSIVVYLSLKDFASTGLSIAVTPYILMALDNYSDKIVLLNNTLLTYLLVTLVLKLMLIAAEKLGIVADLAEYVIKYCMAPGYMIMGLMGIALGAVFWPVVLPFYIFRVIKRVTTQGFQK